MQLLTAHTPRPLDIEVMLGLHTKVNIIPVIAKVILIGCTNMTNMISLQENVDIEDYKSFFRPTHLQQWKESSSKKR